MLEIWDTAAEECDHPLSPLFYRDVDAGAVVFDLADSDTLARASPGVTSSEGSAAAIS